MGSRRATAVGFFPFRLPPALPGVFSSRKPMLKRHLSTSKVLQLYPPACCNSIRYQGIPCHEKFFIFTVFHNKTGFYSGCIHVIAAGAFFRRYSEFLKLGWLVGPCNPGRRFALSWAILLRLLGDVEGKRYHFVGAA